MKNFFNNITSAYKADAENKDAGDLVQTVIIIAGFAIVSIVVIAFLSKAITNKAADSAECIEGSNSYNAEGSAEKCKNVNHAKDNSFKKDDTYKSRYGG